MNANTYGYLSVPTTFCVLFFFLSNELLQRFPRYVCIPSRIDLFDPINVRKFVYLLDVAPNGAAISASNYGEERKKKKNLGTSTYRAYKL